jgi:hypothetical protein
MNTNKQLVDVQLIRNMLYDDDGYVKEFANASIESFTEFRDGFKVHVLERDMDELRRAGHKIKPAALMLNLNPVIEMYETSKKLLENNASTEDLTDLVNEMETFCNRVLYEFEEIA